MNSQFKLTLLSSAVLALTACGGSSDPEPEQPVIDPPAQNQAPTIELATAIDALERDKVEITPTITDDGSISTYQWEQTSGEPVELDATDAATLSFTAPDLAQATTLTFSVTATDNEGASTTSSVDVQIATYPEVDLSLVSDAGLKSCLQEHEDMDAGATELMCQFHAVSSIEGLQQFSKLSSLQLDNAQFVSIPDLSQLEALTELALKADSVESFNNLDSAESLATLKLIDFDCTNTLRLNDLTTLSSLTVECQAGEYSPIDLRNVNNGSLTSLTVAYYNNSSVEGLASMTSLESLSLIQLPDDYYYSEGTLYSLSFLQNMPELKKLEIYGQRSLTDLSALSFTPKLTSLYFAGGAIDDFNVLSKVPALESLNLASMNESVDMTESSVDTIASLENLKEFALTGYTPLDTRPFSDLKNLQSISFRWTDIASISFVESLPELKHLAVNVNGRLADLTPIEALDLEHLDLGALVNVGYTNSLETQTNLKSLSLGQIGNNNELDISFLGNFKQLTSLSFKESMIYDPTVISGVTSLERLAFAGTHINKLPDLSSLVNLEEVSINSSSSLASLEGLSAAPNLKNVSLFNLREMRDYSDIGEIAKLQHLALEYPENLFSINFISKIETLETLKVTNAPELTYIADAVKDLQSLRHISLQSSDNIACSDIQQMEEQFSEISFEHSNECLNNPVDLSLFKDERLRSCVSSEWSLEISNLNRLYCFNYSGNYVSDLSGLEQLTELEYLTIGGGLSADAKGISSLKDLSKLHTVDMSSAIEDFPLQAVVEALPPSVVYVSFSDSRFTDLTSLANIPSGLETLILSYMNFNDISPLLGLEQLQRLDLYGVDSLTCDDINRLQSALPNTGINHYQYCD